MKTEDALFEKFELPQRGFQSKRAAAANKIWKESTMIDYARPCMDAEKALKDAHWAVLDNKPDLAIKLTLEALVEVSKMHAALVHQIETQVK